MFSLLGNKIEEDLNEMKEKGQYDEKYSVNGETIFDKTKEVLEDTIFNDFPNRGIIADLVFEIKGLNL